MTRKQGRTFDRRRFLQAAGAAGVIGIAGCQTGGSDGSDGSDGSGGDGSGSGDLPTAEEAIPRWGERLNEHAREAGIDWRQFEGESLMFGVNVHPFTSLMKNFLPHFEELTGITVQFNEFPEDQLWQRLTLDLEGEVGLFDGMFVGLWPASQYHANGWMQDLNEFIEDPELTDQDWWAMDDFPSSVIDGMTYGADDELVGIPFGPEAYGAIAYDEPTFETLGLEPPENYDDLLNAAQTIHESDEVDKAGIASRASSTTLSSADWGTVHKSFGADWIDRGSREALLNSPEGIEALELFSELMGDYGPQDIGSFDWYRNGTAFGNGDVGMSMQTATLVGVQPDEQYQRTQWVPPLEGPAGQIANTWVWGLGISNFSDNAEAAWLLIQYLISQEANLLQSINAWQEKPTYGWARSEYIYDTEAWNEFGLKDSWVSAQRDGLEMIPSDPPPVPLDVPQNMDIMSEAAIAMNSAVTDQKTAEEALNDAAPTITDLAKEIPESYL